MRAEASVRRLDAVRRRLSDLQLDGVMVTTAENIRYLSGFTGSLGYLLIGQETAEIVGDSRYWIQMEEEAAAFTLVRAGASQGLFALLVDRLKALQWRRTGLEAQNLTVDQYERLGAALDGALLVPTRGMVEELRMLKTPDEVDLLRTVA